MLARIMLRPRSRIGGQPSPVTHRPRSQSVAKIMSQETAAITPKLSTPQAAVDEIERELNVRLRCFPRWVSEGRVSRTDAQDRIDRLHTAYELLKGAVAKEAAAV